MEDVIRLLPDSVANQIAAGEVIQRPASVVKELVENSIDAGATSIEIIIKDAGRTLIQVVDNGKGMSPTDARMAFERHATSKIAAADDLQRLCTMGFRGEALPSVAAVAQIDLRTMRRDDPVGTRLSIAASKVEAQEPCACTPGTNMAVKNLFAYVPARRKFLKKDPVELSHIVHEFERLALVNTQVDFTLISNDVTLHSLHRSSLKQRITALFGKSLGHQLIPVETDTTLVRVSGFIGLPQFARKRGSHQFFFVNGRNMRHPYFHRAVTSCYAQLTASDTQPSYFINLEVDPDRIDVNIHPQKHEIKFEDEQAIWQILTAAVKEALGKSNAAGAIDFDVDDAPDIPLFQPDNGVSQPGTGFDANYNPFEQPAGEGVTDPFAAGQTSGGGMAAKLRGGAAGHWSPDHAPRVDADWQKLYEGFTSGAGDSAVQTVHSRLNSNPELAGAGSTATVPPGSGVPAPEPPPRVNLNLGFEAAAASPSTGMLVLHNRYIVLPSKSGLMIIDRHRAHVRVLYERCMARLEAGDITPQQLLFPQLVQFDGSASALVQAFVPQLNEMGFDLAYLDDNSWNITAVPSMAADADPEELLREVVERLALSGEARESVLQPVATAVARAGAVRSDTVWTDEQNQQLVDDLLLLATPDFTPDGLTIIRTLTNQQIDNLFQ